MMNLHRMIASRQYCTGYRSVSAFGYPYGSTTVSRTFRGEVTVHPSTVSSARSFRTQSIVTGGGVPQNTATALNVQIQQRQQSTVATSTYETSVEAFPSIVIGPDRSIEPQGSFAEAQAQVGCRIGSLDITWKSLRRRS